MQQPTATHSSTPPNAFTVHVSGVLESCTSAHPGALFATLFLLVGQHWQGFNIQLQMVTQLVAPTHDPGPPIVTWSYPFSASWYTSSPSGWPQLLVSVYGVDSARAGGDVLVGYAHVLLPRHAGTHSVCAPMFVPEAAASCTAWAVVEEGGWAGRTGGAGFGAGVWKWASNRQAWQVGRKVWSS
ncbi:ciliary basal body-associated, B9 protein-domain-containing protein [Catenaria anguillulae PL171]|uniref:B9 domain-containing protein 1 n=1 Tax=Catenaria anguillulae PL171 TaxID=765915 RepID=A0A1Y2HL38_9FUNG|nr:ciliary basal body-associated, B9 protein-domain-containing protein [Catenaria anguillulae PL171]